MITPFQLTANALIIPDGWGERHGSYDYKT